MSCPSCDPIGAAGRGCPFCRPERYANGETITDPTSSDKTDTPDSVTAATALQNYGTKLTPYLDILVNIADALTGIETRLSPLEYLAVKCIEFELAETITDEELLDAFRHTDSTGRAN